MNNKKMNNKKNRTIFIWDIHGCYDEFKILIKKLKIKKEDTVYIVGDMINKGPKSFKILKFLYKNKDQYKPILGNHEILFFNYLKNLKNKIDYSFNQDIFYKLEKKLTKNPEILKYLKKIPLFIEKENFLLIHWGLNPEKKIEEHLVDEITKIRLIKNKPWYKYYKWEKKIIYGHWAIQWINITNNTIWIDSWCCYWGYLTAYILETWEIIQQSAIKQYSKIK